MINLSINPLIKPLRLLCLGAHSDDIEIGCGATILDLLNKNPNAEVWWIVFSANEKRRQEAIRSAKYFLSNAAEKRIVIKDFQEISIDGGFRNASINYLNFSIDENLIKFQLSRGSYATIVLREILKPENPLDCGF